MLRNSRDFDGSVLIHGYGTHFFAACNPHADIVSIVARNDRNVEEAKLRIFNLSDSWKNSGCFPGKILCRRFENETKRHRYSSIPFQNKTALVTNGLFALFINKRTKVLSLCVYSKYRTYNCRTELDANYFPRTNIPGSTVILKYYHPCISYYKMQ